MLNFLKTSKLKNYKNNYYTKPAKIIISHVYSFDNKGDAALLSVLSKDIHRVFKHASIIILTMDSITNNEKFEENFVQTSFMHYAMKRFETKPLILLNSLYIMLSSILWAYFYRLTKISLPIEINLKKLCLLYANAELILPVGGGYLRSQKNGIGSWLNIALLLHPIKIGSILKKPTILYTQSIGPFSNKLEELMIKNALNNDVEASIIREDKSVELLRKIGVNRNIYRSIDSGFAFSSNGKKYDIRKLLAIEKDRIIIGITARNWMSAEAQSRYELALSQTIRHIITKYKASVVLIPQVTAEFHGDDDRMVHNRIYEMVQDLKNVYVINEKLDHYQIKSAYDALDLVIGTRFHSVIFSLTSYVPAIAIEYEHKTGGIMKDLALDKWVIKIEEVDIKNLSKMFDKLMLERTGYKKYLKNIMPGYIKKKENAIKIVQEKYYEFYNRAK